MRTNVDDIADLVSDLNLAGNTPSPLSSKASLQDALQTLVQSTNAVTLQIQFLQSDANFSGGPPLAEVRSLHNGTKIFTSIAEELQRHISVLNETAEISVIKHLKSLGEHSPESSRTWSFGNQAGSTLSKMLLHFDRQMRDIVRGILSDTGHRDLLLRVAEECYNQVTCPSGKLDADDYFGPLEENAMGWPYDEDFESERSYEHENRLEMDEGYAASFRRRSEQKREHEKKERLLWPDFWIRVLNNVPGGPTLFYPPASINVRSRDVDDEVPQYLFRTYDEASSGRNSESEIASTASMISPATSRADILALESEKATKLLHDHLDKSCFSSKDSDNFMSWTSSFLFAIQYAIWRLSRRGCTPSDIKLCMIDTSKFPMGQFARDICLLKTYHATAKELQDKSIERFFQLRLGNEDYYNGEFLSQGAVSIADRSCVISLEDLIQAGLFELYPEFGDVEGGKKWAKRALQLRQIWSMEQGTTDREIELAHGIGQKCFSRFEPLHVACILLAFKNRKCSEPKSESKSCSGTKIPLVTTHLLMI